MMPFDCYHRLYFVMKYFDICYNFFPDMEIAFLFVQLAISSIGSFTIELQLRKIRELLLY